MVETIITPLAAAIGIPAWLLIAGMIWAIFWKGFALWTSARKNSKVWFIFLLIMNTLGILEILYIFIFSKMGKREAKPKRRR
jgi:hypothetical protein